MRGYGNPALGQVWAVPGEGRCRTAVARGGAASATAENPPEDPPHRLPQSLAPRPGGGDGRPRFAAHRLPGALRAGQMPLRGQADPSRPPPPRCREHRRGPGPWDARLPSLPPSEQGGASGASGTEKGRGTRWFGAVGPREALSCEFLQPGPDLPSSWPRGVPRRASGSQAGWGDCDQGLSRCADGPPAGACPRLPSPAPAAEGPSLTPASSTAP